VQVRDVMSREVLTVGPETSAKYAAEAMAENGFAALPVVDDDRRLVGIVAEADVLRDRLPADPRLHARRDASVDEGLPSPQVRGVMTTHVRTVLGTDDLSDVARLFVDDRLRSVPVLEDDRLAGIVSRRDLLRTIGRSDAEIRDDLLALVEDYTGESGAWDVTVAEGTATIRRTRGLPQVSGDTEHSALRALARTVGGVTSVRILTETDV